MHMVMSDQSLADIVALLHNMHTTNILMYMIFIDDNDDDEASHV